jgi:hypothetical protein
MDEADHLIKATESKSSGLQGTHPNQQSVKMIQKANAAAKENPQHFSAKSNATGACYL